MNTSEEYYADSSYQQINIWVTLTPNLRTLYDKKCKNKLIFRTFEVT